MPLEIERKFLVRDDSWRGHFQKRSVLRQGYLVAGPGITVRIRTDGEQAWLTIKGPAQGISRNEFEYSIPEADAEKLLGLCEQRVVEKTRHIVPHGRHVWEVDVFAGANQGLVLAEIELASECESLDLPSWVGDEVSGDPRYYNAQLAVAPFARW